MLPLDILRAAAHSLGANRLRSSLALLGIVLGISSVVVLLAIGRGVSVQITDQIGNLGSNLLFVYSTTADELTLDDLDALRDPKSAPSIESAIPEKQTFSRIDFERKSRQTNIVGTTPGFADARNVKLASGVFVTAPHVENRSEVVVLGGTVAQDLFGNRDPVGSQVRIRGNEYTVVGTMSTSGGGGFGSFDTQAFVPYTTVHYRLQRDTAISGQITLSQIIVKVQEGADIAQAEDEIKSTLRVSRRLNDKADDFGIFNQQELLNAIGNVSRAISLFLGSIAGISLLVGGIGIMNIMLVAVTERTREIGIRQAMGAKRRDILAQFVTEAVMLTIGGGLVGVGLGISLSLLLQSLQLGGENGLTAVVSPGIVSLALGVSAAVGLFFGIYPAVRASGLNPIEALRHE